MHIPDLHTLAMDMARMCVWLVLLAVIFAPVERLFTLRPRVERRVWADDLAYFFLNSLLPAALLAIPLAGLAAGLRLITPSAYTAAIAGLPLWLKLAAGILVSETGAYWGHRWSHRSPLLWRFHRIHHAPEHIDWLVNTRAHPVDVVFVRLCGLAPLYAVGLASPTGGEGSMIPVYVSLIGTVWSFFVHANVRWRFGPLEWLVATPAFHHWHHTNDANRDRNFAALLPIVDRAFGTHHLPRNWPPCYGVDEPPAASLAGQLLDPFAVRRGSRLTPQAGGAMGAIDAAE